jgi:hypothetical protein
MERKTDRSSFDVQPLESRRLFSAAHEAAELARPVQTETPSDTAKPGTVTDSRLPGTSRLAGNHNQTLVRA